MQLICLGFHLIIFIVLCNSSGLREILGALTVNSIIFYHSQQLFPKQDSTMGLLTVWEGQMWELLGQGYGVLTNHSEIKAK